MKVSIGKMLVLLAIVLSFTAVQGVWAEELVGTVVDPDDYPEIPLSHAEILLNVDGELFVISGLGPKSYWRSEGILYPKVGDALSIDAYVGLSKNVAVEVCYEDGPCIQLRDPDTLIPLWINFQITETTDLSATANECPNCPCDECEPKLYEHDHDYGGPGPHK